MGNQNLLNESATLKKLRLVFIALTISSWSFGLLRSLQTDIPGMLLGTQGLETLIVTSIFFIASTSKSHQSIIHLGSFVVFSMVFVGIFLVQVSIGTSWLGRVVAGQRSWSAVVSTSCLASFSLSGTRLIHNKSVPISFIVASL